jgi:purine catabolism regulator
VLTVEDIAAMPELSLRVAAGSEGLRNQVSWLHVSELADPTPFLEGGELLLTTGLGIGASGVGQRAYLRRLATHGLAGLGFGVGFDFAEVPAPLAEEANMLGFPVFTVPYEVPFVAITKAVARHLISEQLEQLTRALEIHERLSTAVLEGKGLETLLAIVCEHLDCSLALVDESDRIIAERHSGKPVSFERALELPVIGRDEIATLRAARSEGSFGEYDRLVLHHGQTAVALELSRRRAVSAAELRLAGDLLDDLEGNRLGEPEAARRMAAFGLEPDRSYAALLAAPRNGTSGEELRREVARELDRSNVGYLSTARPDRAEFLVAAETEDEVSALAQAFVRGRPDARAAIGRPARRHALGRSLLEARASLEAGVADVASYRDLGSLELLLGLPDPALAAYVDRVLAGAIGNGPLLHSLAALVECGGRWSEAAEQLGVHRHTLRYRMDRLREQTGRHPDVPEERMELWLALKAQQALAARAASTEMPARTHASTTEVGHGPYAAA